MRAVLKKASWGTRRIFVKASVLKTGFYGTEEIFGAKNSLLWYATHLKRPAEHPTPQTVDILLGYATHFQRRAVPKAATAAPDTSSVRGTVFPLTLETAAPQK